MNAEMVDGVLNFFVNYDFYVYKKKDTVLMEELSESVSVKG